jgi:hypothetical protein
MKGDRVEIVVDVGDATRTYEVVATKAGRRVETAVRRGLVEVTELTRSGAVVRTARFMASRVVAQVEHPAKKANRPSPTTNSRRLSRFRHQRRSVGAAGGGLMSCRIGREVLRVPTGQTGSGQARVLRSTSG